MLSFYVYKIERLIIRIDILSCNADFRKYFKIVQNNGEYCKLLYITGVFQFFWVYTKTVQILCHCAKSETVVNRILSCTIHPNDLRTVEPIDQNRANKNNRFLCN